MVIGVQVRNIAKEKIEAEFGKKYDKAALIAKAYYKITGTWIGHTDGFATDKHFCLELLASLAGLPDPYKVGIKPLLS